MTVCTLLLLWGSETLSLQPLDVTGLIETQTVHLNCQQLQGARKIMVTLLSSSLRTQYTQNVFLLSAFHTEGQHTHTLASSGTNSNMTLSAVWPHTRPRINAHPWLHPDSTCVIIAAPARAVWHKRTEAFHCASWWLLEGSASVLHTPPVLGFLHTLTGSHWFWQSAIPTWDPRGLVRPPRCLHLKSHVLYKDITCFLLDYFSCSSHFSPRPKWIISIRDFLFRTPQNW